MKEKTEKAKELLLSKPCERCGNPNATKVEDPFLLANGYHTKHWLCDKCVSVDA